MQKVTSQDGTQITYDRQGSGPAMILVMGAMGTRVHSAGLAETLAPRFTVFSYDRRGRGDSSDTEPYAVEREVEDIAALTDAAGGSAFLYGLSSGAMLALEAARLLPTKVTKLAMYEPPFIVDDSRSPLPSNYVSHLNELTAAGRRKEAVTYFMKAALEIPDDLLDQIQSSPDWPDMEAIAHTLSYDGAIQIDFMRGKPLPKDRWSSMSIPTLVMSGELSPEFFHSGAQAITDILPNAQYRLIPGQSHGVSDEALAPVLTEFFLHNEEK